MFDSKAAGKGATAWKGEQQPRDGGVSANPRNASREAHVVSSRILAIIALGRRTDSLKLRGLH